MKPIAYGMPRPDGTIIDCITPEEHDREPGQYTVPLYAAPQPSAEPVAWQRRLRLRETVRTFPQQAVWSDWFPCTEQAAKEFAASQDEQWEYEVRTLYTHPQPDDTALLRQALDTLAYWLEHGETPGAHDMIQRTHDALQERLK